MRVLVNLIAGFGDWLVSLSDRTKKQLVLATLLLLVGGGIYKLVLAIERLKQPLPAASPEQLIRPMQQLFEQTKDNYNRYDQARKQEISRLDSLAIHYSTKPQKDQ